MDQQSLTDETLEGTVDHIRYQGDGGWTVAGLESGETIVGEMPGVRVGDEVELTGQWDEHDKYGAQFQVGTCRRQTPTDPDGLAQWLQRIDGFGPVNARRLADEIGDAETIDADTIREADAVTQQRRDCAAEAWQKDQRKRDALIALQGFGLTAKQASKAWERWEASAPQVVESNPYRTTELPQIGFQTADSIARQMGIDRDDDIRLEAGLSYTLKQARDDGHVGLPKRELLSEAGGQLGVRDDRLADPLRQSLRSGDLVEASGLIYRPADDADEQTVASRLSAIDADGEPPWTEEQAETWLEGRDSLTGEQRDAYLAALTDGGVVTLTGGPGTGKTYTLSTICEAWLTTDRDLHLASPTGRAARRMQEATGEGAQTIHRLLQFNPELGFARDPKSLEGLVIIDETSMLDTRLAARLLERISDEATVLLVGDPDQLPSVGPGYVLQDILDSTIGTSVHLTEIHRQAKDSGIVECAYYVNEGRAPDLSSRYDDLGLVEVQGSRHAQKAVEATARRLREKGYDLADDVQVLAPMYNSEAGVDSLNGTLQMIAHGGDLDGGRDFGGDLYVPGDRVMQTTNNYDLGVVNGDVGTVAEMAPEGETLNPQHVTSDEDREIAVRVDFEGYPQPVDYTAYEAAAQLNLSYACTIHKSQGSEYPAAVVVLTKSHWIMCERTLLYTALTRAAEFGVLIAEPEALERACEHHSPVDRHRKLKHRLEDV